MLATVDVGTNTVRGLLGRLEEGRLVPLRHLQQITRLGGGFDAATGLSDAAIERTAGALTDLIQSLLAEQPRALRAVATEAMRKAPNAAVLVEQVRAATGVTLEIISGEEEARLSARGILEGLKPRPDRCLFFDIGGGSTEFGILKDGDLVYFRSFPIGVVRLREDCSHKQDQVARMTSVLQELEADLRDSGLTDIVRSPGLTCVGTAGSVTTLAALEMRMTEYDWKRVNNARLSRSCLTGWRSRLAPLSIEEREALPGMVAGRGDLILPGIDWILAILDRMGESTLVVSDFGLLEGALLTLAEAG